MILPVIAYGDLFYSSASNAILSKLQIVQNKAIRIIHKLKARTNINDRENALDLLPLYCGRQLHILQFAYTLSFNVQLLEENHLEEREVKIRIEGNLVYLDQTNLRFLIA